MRVKGGTVTKKRHKKILRRAEGTWGTRHTSYRVAKQTSIRADQYAYRDRRNKKRDFRRLWISRISAALRAQGYTYSSFMHNMKEQNLDINRKMLSELAISNPEAFNALVKKVMK